ncbi:MAG: multicopper oxidase domain-containing protein [Thaumarchaeota archaeon]|nr:multicopper oxidase domain-containing protein [Nitrososphaerota archaeon]MBI3641588.1 multicopper oxidase domain-containing protein [Nitrososphaerota archaeon]
MDLAIKISLVGLAITVAVFTSIIAYQSLSGQHNHDLNYNGNTAPASLAETNYQGQIRTYYIAADEVKWNYAPTGINQITGKPFDNTANVYMENGKDRIGKVSLKAIYREYTDDTFTTLKPISDKWQHLGILGPVIHAEVGDTIKVVFKNNARFPFSIHPHGVLYDKASEGALYNDGIPESDKKGIVQPGGNYTYIWQVPERAGPGLHDPSSIVWAYHSHVDEVSDTYAGLVGPIIITRHGEANPDGTPKGVDQEFVTMFAIFNENKSPYLDYNINTFAQDPSSVNADDPDFQESNMRHAINGYMYGNTPGLVMKANTHVRWYVVGMGTETDLHTPHWHGETLLMDEMRTDMVELLPMSMKVLDMYPDNVGTWLYHCHVNDHILAGMQSMFTVI